MEKEAFRAPSTNPTFSNTVAMTCHDHSVFGQKVCLGMIVFREVQETFAAAAFVSHTMFQSLNSWNPLEPVPNDI